MSFCRLSDDCDAYVYMTDDGLVDIIIRGSIENPAYSVPEGLDELAEMEFMIKHYDDLYMPWDNHHAGEKFYELGAVQAIEILEAMRIDGVRFPDNVIPDIWKSLDFLDEPSVSDMNEAQ